MTQATQAAFDARSEIEFDAAQAAPRTPAAVAQRVDIRLSLHGELDAIKAEWLAFEKNADCTVFQSFGWLSNWQKNIGARTGVKPVVVAGHDADGTLLFLLPLAIDNSGLVRRLTWLGSQLGDYNAPLLAADFHRRIDARRFQQLWRDVTTRLQSHPDFRYDLVHFEKMPEAVGAQPNPFMQLDVAVNPSGAYLTHLAGDWDTFYADKRSSAATRKGDRYKRKKLSELGEVAFVTPSNADEIAGALDTLMDQKAQSFAHMGVANMFERPGYPQFYCALATDPATSHLAHVSRLDVGATPAAINLGLTFRGCYYHVLASYDGGEVSKYGPGTVHLQGLIRYAIERGDTIFDFTIGDERYKRDWCDTELKLFDHVAAATLRGAIASALLVAAGRAKRAIKQTPLLWNAYYKARSLIGSLRR